MWRALRRVVVDTWLACWPAGRATEEVMEYMDMRFAMMADWLARLNGSLIPSSSYATASTEPEILWYGWYTMRSVFSRLVGDVEMLVCGFKEVKILKAYNKAENSNSNRRRETREKKRRREEEEKKRSERQKREKRRREKDEDEEFLLCCFTFFFLRLVRYGKGAVWYGVEDTPIMCFPRPIYAVI